MLSVRAFMPTGFVVHYASRSIGGRKTRSITDQLPDSFEALFLLARDFEKLVQRKREPGSAEEGEPGDAVAEALDFDRAVVGCRRSSARGDVGERERQAAASRPITIRRRISSRLV